MLDVGQHLALRNDDLPVERGEQFHPVGVSGTGIDGEDRGRPVCGPDGGVLELEVGDAGIVGDKFLVEDRNGSTRTPLHPQVSTTWWMGSWMTPSLAPICTNLSGRADRVASTHATVSARLPLEGTPRSPGQSTV